MYILTEQNSCLHLPIQRCCCRNRWNIGAAASPPCALGSPSALQLLPLRALGRLRFLCGEGVVVQVSVSRGRAVQFVQSLKKKKSRGDADGLQQQGQPAQRAVCFGHRLSNAMSKKGKKKKNRVQEFTKLSDLRGRAAFGCIRPRPTCSVSRGWQGLGFPTCFTCRL